MGALGILNNLLTIFVCFKLLGVWLFEAPFTKNLGFLVLTLMALSSIFILQRVGIIQSHK